MCIIDNYTYPNNFTQHQARITCFLSTIRTLGPFTHPPLMSPCLYTRIQDWFLVTLIDDLHWNSDWWFPLKYWLMISIEILIDDLHWNIDWWSPLKYWLMIFIRILIDVIDWNIDWCYWLKYWLINDLDWNIDCWSNNITTQKSLIMSPWLNIHG
jgi:hypothetical protein